MWLLVVLGGTPSGSTGFGFETLTLDSAKAVFVTSRGDRGFVPGLIPETVPPCKLPVQGLGFRFQGDAQKVS